VKLQEIRQLYDIAELVRQAGYKLGGSKNKWCSCPLPQHQHSSNPTPSFSIFWYRGIQRFKCHGTCGLDGDVIDFAGYMWVPGYKKGDKKLYLQAAEVLTGGAFKISPPTPPRPIPMLPQWLWQDMLPPTNGVIEYALSRGLRIEEIVKFRIGAPNSAMRKEPYSIRNPKDWMAIPTFHKDELIGIKLRNITKSGIRYMAVPGSRKGLFNYNAVYLNTGPILLLKGEIAVMAADRFGFTACAPTGGEGSDITGIQTALALSKVIVVGDNDENPKTREKMTQYAENRAALFNGVLRFPPEEWKDIDLWLLREPEKAQRAIGKWIEEVQ
jgi:hypothetical protein